MREAIDDIRPRSCKRQIRKDFELPFWSVKWEIPVEEIARTIQEVGPLIKDVARELGRAD